MTDFRFIHAADLHLDSPLDHLRSLDAQTATRVAAASRRSVETIVTTAIERDVSALVIAGDLFDGPVRDASSALWIDSQFRKLDDAGIEVVLIRGNHDSLSNASRSVKWSRGVQELGARATSHVIESCGLAVHGQSFGARAVLENIAASYPEAFDGYFNVGLLHTSLNGTSGHDTYAPTSIDVLEGRGFDYWALGHIHQRTPASLSPRCWIGFSGNTQGRHVRESGPKGCNLVHVQNRAITNVEFIETDTVRWFDIELNISELDSLSDLAQRAGEACERYSQVSSGTGEFSLGQFNLSQANPKHANLKQDSIEPNYSEQQNSFQGNAQHRRSESSARHIAIRLRLTGAAPLHAALAGSTTRQHVAEAISAQLREMGSIWLETIKFQTHAPTVRQQLGDCELPLGTLQEIVKDIHSEPNLQKQLMKSLEDLGRKARGALSATQWQLWNDTDNSQEFARLLDQAEQLLGAWVVEEPSQ